jgi:hypothetical protein
MRCVAQRGMSGRLRCRMLAYQVSFTVSRTGERDQPIALRGAPRAGGGEMGYLELPGRELGAFIDRIDRDKRA